MAAPASSAPVCAPVTAASQPALDLTGCDLECQREVLAGMELELGDERARTAATVAKNHALEQRVTELMALGHQLNNRATWLPIVAGVIGSLLGAAIAGGTAYVVLVRP